MNEENLQIGQIYTFAYKNKTPSKKKKAPVKAKLKDTVVNDLAKELQENKQQIQESFENKLSRYRKEMSHLIALTEAQKEERKGEMRRKLNEDEIRNLNQLEGIKEELFPKEKKEKTNKQKAIDLFFRAYLPENMQVDDENGNQIAIYAGPRLTTKGNITHNWIALEAVLEQDKIPQEANEFLSEIASL